jgi:hypothetical protein
MSLLLLGCLAFSAWQPKAVHAQVTVTYTLTSEPGDLVIGPTGRKHHAVLSYGHAGCLSIDAQGFCAGGLWLTIAGAHWIWATRLVPGAEAVYGTAWLTFARTFTVPSSATNITGRIQITADDVYELYLNGLPVGAGGSSSQIGTWSLTPRHGSNTLRIRAFSLPGNPTSTPSTNPAGLIYSAQISFLTSQPTS